MASPTDPNGKTSLKLTAEQLKKLQVLADALPREKSRLVGELIDEVWDTLPVRIPEMARECALRILEGKWRGLSGHNAIPTRDFRKLEPGRLSAFLTFTRQDVHDAFHGKAWRDWKVAPAPNPREKNPKIYFPRVPSVAEMGEVAAVLAQPGDAGEAIKETLIGLTFKCLEMIKAESLKELTRKPAKVSKEERSSLDQNRDLQPDQQAAILEFKKLQSEGKIPIAIPTSTTVPAKSPRKSKAHRPGPKSVKPRKKK